MRLLILLTAAAVINATAALSQTAISYDYKDKKVILPAIRKELSKEDKYTIVMPSRLTYFFSKDEILNSIWSPFINNIDVKARVHLAKPDYKFEIVTSGIQKIELKEIRWYKTEVTSPNGVPNEVNGFVKDYACTFPCKLVVSDAQGNVLETITIADESESFTATLHRDFLQNGNPGTSLKAVIPFATQEEIALLETTYSKEISKKIEQMIAYEVFTKTASAISYLYKDYNTSKLTYGFGFVKSKGGNNNFAELDKVVSDYKNALDSLSEGKFEVCSKLCQGNKLAMESLLSSNDSRVDKNVKEIIYYNLSHAYLLTNNYDDAWKYYHLFIKSGVSERTRLASELRGRINFYQFHSKIKKQFQASQNTTP